MKLEDYLNKLSWSQTDLARNADIAVITATHALEGKTVKRFVATKIASALSEALGRKVEVSEIDGLKISPLRIARKAKES
ncbi:MAG: XRE family transcriptional regulator [Gammaproteobacteria bacterium]|nr:XRE family transcriptional regulator [Gammaproteobacteria bacterium]